MINKENTALHTLSKGKIDLKGEKKTEFPSTKGEKLIFRKNKMDFRDLNRTPCCNSTVMGCAFNIKTFEHRLQDGQPSKKISTDLQQNFIHSLQAFLKVFL